LKKDIDFRVVEADADMVDYLHREYKELEDKIIFLDFLKLNLQVVFDGHPFLLIGNYPYNISSQIIFRMLKYRDLIPQMVGMFQKEVADRIIAPHGNKTYGVLSVLTQAYYTGKMVMKISPGSFSPPPKVNSAVIKLERKENYELPCDERLFRRVVKLTFGQRRKMLRNTVKTLVQNPAFLEDDFLKNRPEQLSLEQFILLTTLIEEQIQEQKRKEEE
jgi:16S rRNA (adenine1518-N6/adenine1519-N6)-dimethyltransferase